MGKEITYREAANLLGVELDTIYMHVARGKLHPISKPEMRIKFLDEDEVIKYRDTSSKNVITNSQMGTSAASLKDAIETLVQLAKDEEAMKAIKLLGSPDVLRGLRVLQQLRNVGAEANFNGDVARDETNGEVERLRNAKPIVSVLGLSILASFMLGYAIKHFGTDAVEKAIMEANERYFEEAHKVIEKVASYPKEPDVLIPAIIDAVEAELAIP